VADWRVILGDVTGTPLANISAIAKDRSILERLNRPKQFRARVPSGHALIANSAGDGYPKLSALRRTIFVLRRERQADSSCLYVPRFAGRVWTLQDSGDEDDAWTSIVAFDPFQALRKRFCRNSTGGVDTPDPAFTATDGAQVLKTLVDRTNTYAGETGIATTGVFDATAARDVTYQRKSVGDAAVDLTSAQNGFDVEFEALGPGDVPGKLVKMHARAQRGAVRPDVVFSYAKAPRTARSIDRTEDAEDVANYLQGLGSTLSGGDELVSTKTGTTTGAFGAYEDVVSFTDVDSQGFLDARTQEEVNAREFPKSLLRIVPHSGRRPRPWDDFDVGDTVRVEAGAVLRGGFSATARVFGFDVSNDDDGVEAVTSVVTDASGV
jgi:hypothetical protein